MRFLFSVLGFLIFIALGSADQAGAQPSKESQASAIKVEDTNAFFVWFLSMKQKSNPPKSDFETEAQYKKRLPPPFDSSKIKYFSVPIGFEKPFRYDLATKTLTFFSGEKEGHDNLIGTDSSSIGSDSSMGGDASSFPLILASAYSALGTYKGTNAFGVSVEVKRSMETDWVLNLQHSERWSNSFYDSEKGRFAVSTVLDAETAKKLSRRCQLIRQPTHLFMSIVSTQN